VSITHSDILAANILIVDDQPANVELLEQLLAQSGYTQVSATTSALEVCDMHRKNRYDLILLDLQMPGMDGFEVMSGLNAIESDSYAPVLAMTAQPGHKLRALASGAKDFIAKPYDLVEVKTRIHNMLELRLLYKRLEAANRRLELFALTDPLTGLPNRRLLTDRVTHAMAASARTGDHCALMFLDLDHFKRLNDTQGHGVGDLLLQNVAARLLACVREGDTVARIGGDEFVVLLEGLGSHGRNADSQARLVSNKILDHLARPHLLENHSYATTASIGVVVFKGTEEPIEKLLKKADLAMYDAKTTSGNAAHFFEPTMQS
jgi:diguanylate cyclase (GGDEF)-like protein